MSSEVIKLNLIPKGDMPIFHASQFDNGRIITCQLYRGEDEYTVPTGYTVELHCRKADNNIVTMEATSITANTVTFTSTTQLTACYGNNICEVCIIDGDYLIGSLNFILEVERDPLEGGISSTSEIYNIQQQIEDITHEVIAEDYYTKSEVNTLLDEKADTSDLPDMSQYYNKSSVDGLLNNKADKNTVTALSSLVDTIGYGLDQLELLVDRKADKSELPDMTSYYNKTEVNSLLSTKADKSELPDMDEYYTKSEVDNKITDILPVGSASGSIANFETELSLPLVTLKSEITAVQESGTPSPSNPLAITGFDEVNLFRTGVNLFDKTTAVNGYIDDATGNFISNSNYRATDYIKVESGGSYYIITEQTGTAWGAWYDENKNYISGVTMYHVNNIITAPNNAKSVRLTISSTQSGNVNTFGINYPSTDHEYHSYEGRKITLSLNGTRYGGVLDVTRGKFNGTKKDKLANGTESWQVYTTSSNSITFALTNAVSDILNQNDQISNMFTYNANAWDASRNLPNTFVLGTSKTLFVQVSIADFPDTNSFKTFLNNNNLNVVYNCTPFDIDLTPEVIEAIAGTNNIWSDTGACEVEYKDTIQNYIDTKLSSQNSRSLNTLSLKKAEIETNEIEESEEKEDE